ncbi:MAG: TerB family tellurite resistance protein [Alcanivoracaceae bacterium]
MIGKWLQALTEKVTHQETDQGDDRLAAAALMYEVARADGTLASEELTHMVTLFARRWSLPDTEAGELLDAARQQAEDATDYHELVMAIRRQWSAEKRAQLVHDMWEIAHADVEGHHYEEYVIRKVADLLYVSHSDFIRGKLASEPPR